MRCVHEASLHAQNSFLTLTYDDQHLPKDGSLQKPDLQKFLKRLRARLAGKTIRYYACGEYGDHTQRAHYHVCLFGHDFTDKVHFRRIGEHNLYISETLNEVWGNGHTSIGSLTFETAAYTARYVTKKQTGGNLDKYVKVDPDTGEVQAIQQPFAVMSLRQAIAREWHSLYSSDLKKDFISMRGKKLKPTRYYDKLYDKADPSGFAKIKETRKLNSQTLTDSELRARETITRARLIYRTQI